MGVLRRDLAFRTVCRRSMLLSALVTVMFGMLVAVPSRADDVTFLDSTDTLDFSTSSARISTVCSTTETCVAAILAPSGSVFETSEFTQVFIAEADGTVSDAIIVTPNADGTSVQVAFVSEVEGVPVPCDVVGGCPILEDGTVQLGNTISWVDVLGNITTDTVSFQSDLDVTPPVPEPASLTLLGSGFLAVVGYIRRRRLA